MIENETKLQQHVEKFFPKETLRYTSMLPEFSVFVQMDLSCYIKKLKDNMIQSESNCSTTSAFNVLSFLRDSGHYPQFSKLPSSSRKMRYNPKVLEYDAYSYYKSLQDKYYFHDDEDKPCKEWQDLYVELRNEARAINYKYMAESLWTAHTSRIMEIVCSKYGIEGFDGIEHTDYNAYVGSQEFKDTFDNFKPALMTTTGCCYGTHTFMVTGYKMYSREVKKLWTKTEWSTILTVKDGWSSGTRYFNITHYRWDHHGTGIMTSFKWK